MKIARQNLSFSVLVTWATIILVLVGTLGVAACSPSSQIPPENAKEVNTHGIPIAPEVGRMAPDFTLTTLDGDSITLSDFRGKAVFVNFWAT